MSIRCALTALSLSCATAAMAQQPRTPAVHPTLVSAVSRLAPQQQIRVAYMTNWVEGTFVRAGGDTLVMRVDAASQPLALAIIDTLSTRRRSTIRGSIAGAFLGAGIGVLAGMAFEHKTAPFGTGCSTCSDFPRHSLFIGIGGGAAIGAALGHSHFRWHRLYARKAAWE